MNILILANNDIGLYKFRKELLEELLKKNKVYFCVPYGEYVEKIKSLGCKYIKTEMDRRGINPFVDLKLVLRYDKIVKKLKPDLVITYTIKPNIYGSFICRLNKIPCAVNITGLGTAFQKNGIIKFLVVNLYRLSLKKAKVIFFENSGDRDIFVNKTGIQLNKTYVLHGAGVNTTTFDYQQYPNNEMIKFLFVGRVMKEKGIEELIEAGRRLVLEGYKCTIDIVGPCEENYIDLLQKCENDGWLKYHGFQTDVRPFIRDCDCFVLPSYHEGMANTNLECASSGRVIITSDIPGCREACIDGGSGYLCKVKNSEDLYNKMKIIIMSEKDELIKMGVEGRKLMIKQFKKELIVNNTLKALQLI